MGDAVDRLGAVLLDGAVAATALLGVAALAMVACGQPARRLVLGRVAVVGALALLPLAVYAPMPRIPVTGLVTFVATFPGVTERAGLGASGRRVMVAAAGCGVAISLLGMALGFLAGRRLLARTVEPAPETLALYESLPCAAWTKRPPVRVSARVRGPVLIGALRPTILIPPDLEEPEGAGGLRLGLLHELSHFERRDPAYGLVGRLAASLWFFVPPVWWVRHQMRLDQEFLADRRASARFGPGAAYASSLVGLAESGPAGEDARGGRAEAGRGVSALFQRVLMLVRCPYPVEARAPRPWAFACAIAMACGTIVASGFTLRTPPPPSPPDPGPAAHGSLQVGRLVLPARAPGRDGPIPPYTLLRALPRRFELVVDVLADPSELPHIAIAGRRLGIIGSPSADAQSGSGYHKVRLVGDDCGLRLWVDGRPVPPGPYDAPMPPFLALEPAPDRIGRFRNLFLTY